MERDRAGRAAGDSRAGGYVATRQRDINQIMDANAGQVIGAGNAGPLFVHGRTGATGILSNPGWSDYDSLQVSLMRRLAHGLQANVSIHVVESVRHLLRYAQRQSAACRRSSTSLNEARLPQDRPHNFQASFVAELPFGAGKPFLNEGGVAAAVFGGWH